MDIPMNVVLVSQSQKAMPVYRWQRDSNVSSEPWSRSETALQVYPDRKAACTAASLATISAGMVYLFISWLKAS